MATTMPSFTAEDAYKARLIELDRTALRALGATFANIHLDPRVQAASDAIKAEEESEKKAKVIKAEEERETNAKGVFQHRI